jgi:hypothetical protein
MVMNKLSKVKTPIDRYAVGICVLPILFLLFFSFYSPLQALLQPDSDSYLNFNASRTGGYPFFLAVLKPIVGNVHGYITAQLIFYATCVVVIGWQFFSISKSIIVTIGAQVLLLGNPLVNCYHFTIMTKSVFLSTSILFIAASIAYLSKRSGFGILLVSMIGGAAASIRPTGLVFIGAALLLAVLIPTDRRRIIAHILITLVSIICILGLDKASAPSI